MVGPINDDVIHVALSTLGGITGVSVLPAHSQHQLEPEDQLSDVMD